MGTPTAGFVHLHLHSEYSLLDGANRIQRLVDRVKALGMDAVALTDHGNLHGAVEFYTKARAAGVKPILGIEAYVAAGDRTSKVSAGGPDGGFHLVLLAETTEGWRNLVKLSSDAFLNGFYYKPRMDRSTLTQYARGLIAINGHLGSSIAHHLTQYAQGGDGSHYRKAIEEARWHAETFGPSADGEPCFFLEIQRHGIEAQDRINPLILRLAEELDLPVVADNDTHFLLAEDHDVHDSLCCISMGRTKDDESRLRYSPEIYLKSPEQMAELFADVPEAIENTVRIGRRCEVELDTSANHAPMVRAVRRGEPPAYDGGDRGAWFREVCRHYELSPYDAESANANAESLEAVRAGCDGVLAELCEAGLVWRYGPDGVTPEIRERLEWELSVLSNKLISAYFLIVFDFVNWARQQGIPAGARGSGVGTMVGYALGLSHACPLRYGLLFERFTDPDRSEYPDIDVDICQDGRGKVIEYVRRKYGYVAQIITFGRLKARAAIKDVARVQGLTPAEGQRLSNLVPNELNITIEAAVAREPDLAAEIQASEVSRRVIETARAIEGHARHAGVHAAGVVIATEPLDNIVPLYRAAGSDDVVTQWDGPTCERMGLLKMDFLGLRTLSTIERAVELIRESLPDEAVWRAVGREPGDGRPHPLDLERLRYDDPRVFELFGRADTAGVFQFESGGMRRLLADMKPDRIEDLIAANALFRPGPMDLIPDYIRRKHGKEKVPSLHPIVDEHTAETYGIMVYQEQVMQIVYGLGDIPLRDAYSLIKAISKKKRDVIDSARPRFVKSAKAKGLTERRATDLFELILKFAGYGFNKCVVGETEIIDAATGLRTTVGALFEQFQTGTDRSVTVHALGADWTLRPRRVLDVLWNGTRPVFELRTRNGRRIVATANHPFRTRGGWTDLADLRTGDAIAAAAVFLEQREPAAGLRAGSSSAATVSMLDAVHLALCWDTVEGIEPAGRQDVYDLTVEEDHNFVADGLVVHNSHSTGYAIIAYETAYLKTYFPNQYMAALLTFESAARKVEDWVPYLEDCKLTRFPDSTVESPHHGVVVRPPDVNSSDARFTVVFDEGEAPDACRGHVRFGLGAIRGASASAVASIIAEREAHGPFDSIFDFCERVDLACVNRATIESLVKSGAFDSMHGPGVRAAVLAAVADAIAAGQGAAADRKAGQFNFLQSMDESARKQVQRRLPEIPPWDRMQTLGAEKEVLGFHVSGHPLDLHDDTLARWATTTARGAAELADKTEVRMGGIVAQLRTRIVKNGRSAGQKMALCSLQDKTGAIEAVIFSDAYAKYASMLANDAIVAVTGKLDRVRGEPSVVVEQVMAIDQLPRHLAGRLEIDFVTGPELQRDEDAMHEVERLLSRAKATNGGRQVAVMLNVLTEGKRIALKPHALKVVPEDDLLGRLREIVGAERVRVIARGVNGDA